MKDHAPSAERNKSEILPVLEGILPGEGTILEVASGTGQHAAYFAPRFPKARWQPTERRVEMFPSIRAWAEDAGATNVASPLALDVTQPVWPLEEADAVVAINMLHISPWETCLGLLAGAARVLPPGAPLAYYGALFRQDRETVPSNLAFDASLRARDASWGVRHLEEILAAAQAVGLSLGEVIDMPNNNSLLVLRR